MVGECGVGEFEVVEIGKGWVVGSVGDGEEGVKEIVEGFGWGKVVGSDGRVERGFGCMWEKKEGEWVCVFEVVEVYDEGWWGMGFVDGGGEVGKIVKDEDFGGGLERDVLYGWDDGLVEMGLEEGIGVKG